MSIPHLLDPGLSGIPESIALLGLLAVSLLLIFAGRTIVKVLAVLVVGLVGASIGGMLGAQYLGSLGSLGSLLGILLGFVVGGIIGVALVMAGIGIAVGYGAYLLTLDLVSSTTAALAVGAVFFIIGIAFYGKILTLVTALAGGLLLLDVLRMYGLGPTLSTVLAVLVTAAGIWIDYGLGKRRRKPTTSNLGGQSSGQH